MNVANLLPFLAAAFPSAALAGPYGPFDSSENYVVALGACETVEDVQQFYPPLGSIDFARAGDEARLHLTMAGNEHYGAQVFLGAVPRGQAVNVNVGVAVPTDVRVDGAVCDDLNGDGASDFVVALWGHGNGLVARFYDRLIALSAGDNYRFWVLQTMDPSREDFVRFSAARPIVMVTQEWVHQNERNGAPASYFVFDLWSFSGGEVFEASSLDRRFPKWVRYTYVPSSRPAPLSDADKRRLRSAPQQPIEAVPSPRI